MSPKGPEIPGQTSADDILNPSVNEVKNEVETKEKRETDLLDLAEKHKGPYMSTEDPEGCTPREYFNAYLKTDENGKLYQRYPDGMKKAFTDLFDSKNDLLLLADTYKKKYLRESYIALENAQKALEKARSNIDRNVVVPSRPIEDYIGKVEEKQTDIEKLKIFISFLHDLSGSDK